MTTDSIPAPARATPFTTKPDGNILAAWERITAAHAAIAECTAAPTDGSLYSPEEQAQWRVNDAAEVEILKTIGESPVGAEIQLWVALIHLVEGGDAECAILRRDLGWFAERDADMNWSERLILSAIRSLRAIGGAA